MVSGINTSINGALDAASRVQDAAQRIASVGAARPAAASETQALAEDTVELQSRGVDSGQDDTTRALIDQKIATYDFKANLVALKVQDENEKHVVDILG